MEAREILSNHLYKSNITRNQRIQTHAIKNANENDSVETMNLQNTPTLSFAQLETICYCCGKKNTSLHNVSIATPFQNENGP